jgi:beta-lactam-binding protein with PASTA domain
MLMRTSALFLVFALAGVQPVTGLSLGTAFEPFASQTSDGPRQIDRVSRLAQLPVKPAPDASAVPNLIGSQESAAPRVLAAARLTLGKIERRESGRAQGTILDQIPRAGTPVRPGTPVHLLVSSGKSAGGDDVGTPERSVAVPNVVGQQLDGAQAVLRKSSLRVGDVKTRESRAERGTVLDQSPRGDTQVSAGTLVHLLISAGSASTSDDVGPSLVPVPNLVGAEIDAVPSVLEKSSLHLGDVKTRRASAARGTILDQSPRPLTQVAAGSRVHVLVSEGAQTPTQTAVVPNVIGEHIDRAALILRGALLRPGAVQTTTAAAPEGTVLKQSLEPGLRVSPGSSVAMLVSQGEPFAVVPDLVNAREEDAAALLARAQLELGAVNRQEAQADAGTIVAQSPVAGSRVVRGTPVRVIVSSGERFAIVPDLVKSDFESALRLVAKERLRIGDVERKEVPIRPGIVLAQTIAAGSRVRVGTPVGVIVSVEEPLVIVPSLSGSVDAVSSQLNQVQLRLGSVNQQESSTVNAGLVIAQAPLAGLRVRRGTPVDVVVSTGEPMAIVPDVVNSDTDTAARLLGGAQLRLGEVQRREVTTGAGVVLAQAVAPGSRVRRGTPIAVLIAVEAPLVIVPDLVDTRIDSVGKVLAQVQLQVGAIDRQQARSEAGVVLAQRPIAGSQVRRGTAVAVTVSSGPPDAVIPASSSPPSRPSSAPPPSPPPQAPSPETSGIQAAVPTTGVAITPVPAPSPSWSFFQHWPWAWAAFVAFGALYKFQRSSREKAVPTTQPKAANPPTPAVKIVLQPRVDAGRQQIAFERGEIARSFELAFRADPGTQQIVDSSSERFRGAIS